AGQPPPNPTQWLQDRTDELFGQFQALARAPVQLPATAAQQSAGAVQRNVLEPGTHYRATNGQIYPVWTMEEARRRWEAGATGWFYSPDGKARMLKPRRAAPQ